ncbi:MAG: isoprenylcysteine carboxylmethyltransferase family protein, partial [Candidatus Tectomicrobia bacterium]|nr:isoprenylcysteine carboxylmethyltransferase family protein [Candidatus Tectomicrobia bacterium]
RPRTADPPRGSVDRRQEAVTGGLYAVVRHPQYVGLAIVGLGTLLLWPRFLVLVMYITMLFLYYFLACWEEEQCVQKFGESYRTYQESTGMFFPGRLFKKFPLLLPPSGRKRISAALALYVVVIVATVSLGYQLRDYSLSRLSALYTEDMAVISTALLTNEELSKALQIAMGSADVLTKLKSAGYRQNAKLLAYVVPLGWNLPDLPMGVGQDGRRDHSTFTSFDRRFYKVLFTKVRTYEHAIRGQEIITKSYGRDPIVLVKINTDTAQITGIETPPPHVRWGDIPTPMF